MARIIAKPRPKPPPPARTRRSGKALLVRAAVLGLVAALVGVWTRTRGAGVALSAAESRRAADSLALLAVLVKHGATHVPLAVGPTAYGGLGIKVSAPVTKGAVIFSLPSSLMVKGSGQATLPLALARERLNPTSEHMAAYRRTLPAECPPCLAARSSADLALASSTLHKWKATLLDSELKALRDSLPELSDADRRWATCMKMSRAFAGIGDGPVLMPFLDLLNHDGETPSSVERGRWVDRDQGVWVGEVVAKRDLLPGDEVTYEYVESPSRARLLTSFGHEMGAPDASLAAEGLPDGDGSGDAIGCPSDATPRTELRLDSRGKLSGAALRAATKCVRLRLYSREEAAWALQSGHFDAPTWLGAPDAPPSVLEKDSRVAANTAMGCAQAQSDEQRAGQRALLGAASADLAAAVAAEGDALAQCAAGLREAHFEIEAHLERRAAGS